MPLRRPLCGSGHGRPAHKAVEHAAVEAGAAYSLHLELQHGVRADALRQRAHGLIGLAGSAALAADHDLARRLRDLKPGRRRFFKSADAVFLPEARFPDCDHHGDPGVFKAHLGFIAFMRRSASKPQRGRDDPFAVAKDPVAGKLF